MKHHAKLALAAVAVAAVLVACNDNFPTLSNRIAPRTTFVATLDGAAERPTPVTTTASGKATATVIPTHRDSTLTLDTNLVRVEVLVSGITNVTAAHIHAGDANSAGPVMIGLFSATTPLTVTGTDRVLRLIDITRTSTFTAPFRFDSLLARLAAGTAYINVHTSANPGGEIRGQLTAQP